METFHSSSSYEETFRELKRAYLHRLEDNVSLLDVALEQGAENFYATRSLEMMVHITHNLAGSGATFGFPDITAKARTLSASLKKYIKSEEAADWAAMSLLVRDLCTACRQSIAQDTAYFS